MLTPHLSRGLYGPCPGLQPKPHWQRVVSPFASASLSLRELFPASSPLPAGHSRRLQRAARERPSKSLPARPLPLLQRLKSFPDIALGAVPPSFEDRGSRYEPHPSSPRARPIASGT